jgi:glycosyltransferase involved in cell wall biosynthesis
VNACVLIPIFDHGATIRAVVESLAPHGLPCLIVDDGSDRATREVLRALADELDSVTVHRRERNGGRGAALKTGYRLAAELGFTHTIQVDADGQHDTADIPRFLEVMKDRPDAMVLGVPLFDDSAPKSRLVGRQLSVGMVWACTLTRAIRDPLCGFRGLPLAHLLPLLERVKTGDYMEFDPELTVRLYWDGLEVVGIPTRVVYDPDGLSHFDVVWDDLRMAGVYTRLLVGMIPRVGMLLRRRAQRSQP